jgi:hypothetical protein
MSSAAAASPGAAAPAVPVMNSVSLVYSQKEDRLVMTLGNPALRMPLLLTRHLAGGLLNGLADVLAKTSPGAKQAPAQARESMLLFEHHEAVQAAARKKAAAGSAQPKAPAASAPQRLAPVLLTAVDIAGKGAHFSLNFKDAEQTLAAFHAGRHELHQLLDLLRSKTVAAQWALSLQAGWLDAGAAKLRMN